MATIDLYKIKIEVDGQQKVVDLTDKVDELSARLGLAATAGVAAFAALARSAVTMADTIVDTADAIGLSASRVYQLNAALEASGGEFGTADGLLRGFSKTLGDVQKGTKDTVAALNKLGLSKDKLAILTEEEQFQAVINALGDMQGGFERNRIGMELFGKAADGIDWTKMAEGTRNAADPELEKRLRVAADTVDQLQAAFREFQLAALAAITPILEVIKDMNITADDAKKTIQVLGALIAAAFSVAIVTQLVKVVTLFKTLVTTMRAAATAQAFLTALIPGGLLLVGTAAAAAAAAYVGLGKAMEDAGNEAQKFKAVSSDLDNVSASAIQSYSDGIKKLQKQLKDGTITQDQFNKKAAELEKLAKTPRVSSTGRTTNTFADNQKIAAEQAKRTTEQLRQQLNIQNQYQQLVISTIGRRESERDLILEIGSLARRFKEDELSLETQIADERKKGNEEVVRQLQERIALLREQYNIDVSNAANSKTLLDNLKNQQKIFADNVNYFGELEKITQETGNLIADQEIILNSTNKQAQELLQNYELQSGTWSRILDLANRAAGIGTEHTANLEDQAALFDEILEYAENNESAQDNLARTHERLNQLAESYRGILEQIPADKRAEVEEILKIIDLENFRLKNQLEGLAKIKAVQDEINNSYSAGVKQALENIGESFKPYTMAQDAIEKGWGRMSDALDEFVETGKLNFADLARSIINDITKMILKMLVFKAIEAGLNAIFPGLGTAFSAITGKATGGPVNKDTPYVVGERGPELFVPQKSGNIIPNNKLNNGVSEMRQPVTNNTYNNYYINALDAKSVAQVFAENRKALFGANKMAEREMSYAGVR